LTKRTLVAMAAAAVCSCAAFAQQSRPDSGTPLQQDRQLPQLPAPSSAPAVQVPQPRAAASYNESVKVTPAAFRLQGNTLYTEAELQPLLAEFVGKPTDMEGLVKATQSVRRYYRDRGYLLTEAYLPEQQFSATGGTVVIQVLEAKVGKVTVRAEDAGVSESLASSIVNRYLKPGDAISEYSLEKPVLLLRDLVGFEATAAVQPGTAAGEGDITVLVKSAGPKFDGLVGADNFGARSAGQNRVFANTNWNNPTGRGDVLSLRVQAADRSHSDLYRLAYSTTLGSAATKVGVAALRTQYSLGKQFAALGATGDATIYSLNLTQPFLRSRTKNVLGALTLERKDLNDRTTTPQTDATKRVNLVRASVLGNFVDDALGSSFNSYSFNVSSGKLDIDPANLIFDQSLTTGLHTAGSFSKINVEYLRTTFVSARGRFSAALQAQVASKNLTSAEKLGLGGPNGVRGYPVGEGVGDTGAILNLEYRHQLMDLGKVPLAGSLFYDWGHVKYNEAGVPASLAATTTDTDTLRSAGLGVQVGNFGDYLLSTQVAWRLSRAPTSDPDKRPRVWLSLQKWL
jgi:hemolysin activation/secretion protein